MENIFFPIRSQILKFEEVMEYLIHYFTFESDKNLILYKLPVLFSTVSLKLGQNFFLSSTDFWGLVYGCLLL